MSRPGTAEGGQPDRPWSGDGERGPAGSPVGVVDRVAAAPTGRRPGLLDRELESTAAGPSAGALWRRHRVPLLVVVTLLLVAAGIGVVSRRGVGGVLDPRAADPDGSRALAVLLGDRGVEVSRNTSLDAAIEATTSRDSVLVAFPDLLPGDALRRLANATVARVILVGPHAEALAAVTDEIEVAGDSPVSARPPDCGDEAANAAGVVEIGGVSYRATGGGTGCYPADSGSALVLARTRGGSDLVVLGAGDPLTNRRLGEQGNAALGLNLLGADGSADRVRWLVPTPGSAVSQDHQLSLSDILPYWVVPAAVQLLLAAVLAGLWRARRLGPPVTEPLPVVVRAAESVEGRARLYRRAQARDRAVEALRAGALARLVPRLGLDPSTGGEPAPTAVVQAVTERSGIPEAEVSASLYGPVPIDDAGLVRLADLLDTILRSTLDSEVRRS